VCVCVRVRIFSVVNFSLPEMVNKVEYIIAERPSVEVTPTTSVQEKLKATF